MALGAVARRLEPLLHHIGRLTVVCESGGGPIVLHDLALEGASECSTSAVIVRGF